MRKPRLSCFAMLALMTVGGGFGLVVALLIAVSYSAMTGVPITAPFDVIFPEHLVRIEEGYSCDRMFSGSGIILIEGAVTNTSRQFTLELVEVRGTVRTTTGTVVGTGTDFVGSNRMAPGETATFSIWIEDPEERASTSECRVQVADALAFDD